MKIAALLNVVSPHQLPLAKELVKLVGEDNYRYVYVDRVHCDRVKLGWAEGVLPAWCIPMTGNENVVENADALYSGVRDIGLFERRAKSGKTTFYYSERWFKPVSIVRFRGVDCSITGRVRMLFPAYRKMARRFVRWLNTDQNARYLAVGPWAAKDMRCIGVNPSKIVPWGYFVEPSTYSRFVSQTFGPSDARRLLWVGRLLALKRVNDIIRAMHVYVSRRRKDKTLPIMTCDVYGDGPEKERLRRMVSKMGLDGVVKFYSSVPIVKVRELMRSHDVYVFSSNAYEGWGAVVSEALEEGMRVIGTYESGASATILPESNLYHAGDWRRLAQLFMANIKKVDIGEWTAKGAARRMLALCK